MEVKNWITNSPLATLRECGGYYECPKDLNGKRLGPLVGYAGTYNDDAGNQEHFVGDVYYNFARAEQYPAVLAYFAARLAKMLVVDTDVLQGSPMGGILLAGAMGRYANARVIFSEKKITALAIAGQREQSVLVIDRHEILHDDEVVIVEDVCNNFSTTTDQIQIIEDLGGKVVAVACFLNRSSHVVVPETFIPVFSLLHIPTVQYKQSDPAVADDVIMSNVAWKPKREWPRLAEAMKLAESKPA